MPPIKIAHIIHPVIVPPDSDLVIAQPITFETMKIAREFTKDDSLEISLFAIQYHDEKKIPLPDCFQTTPNLFRSIAEKKSFGQKRKLALIKDILDTLYHISPDADFMIYSNVDIALQPYFYQTVTHLIHQGYDAFVINRRTIPSHYSQIKEIPLMYAEVGEKHRGWDCFIFKRELNSHFVLGTACIGTGWIGRILITNLSCFAKKFEIFTDLHLTFHIGNEKVWKSIKFDEYLQHNKGQCEKILKDFDSEFGPFDRNTYPGIFIKKHFE